MLKFKFILSVLRSLPSSIYFNFHYLPFKQAIKLPILLYKPNLLSTNGLVQILGGVKFGLIRLGFNQVSLYPNNGITWENNGTVIFNGRASIGNNSVISVGKNGHLTFGDRFRATTTLKCVCYNKVTFDSDVLIGWECTISDTDFHSLQYNGNATKGYGAIYIGRNNWIAMQSLILKDSKTPPYTVIAARSLINRDYTSEQGKILLSGQPAKVTLHDIYHDRDNDSINYGCINNNCQL